PAQRCGPLSQGSAGNDQIVNDQAVLVGNVADDIHYFGDIGFLAPFVDDGQGCIQAFGDGPCPFHAAGVGGHHNQFFGTLRLEVVDHDRAKEQVIDGNIEEALN